jgi:hypothetical protein
MNYKTMNIQDIIAWCKANNQTEWLKAKANSTTKCKVYPRKSVTREDGKVVAVADKSQKPVIEERPITFIQIKKAFAETFMPEILPKKKEAKATMYDLIAGL